MQKFKTTTDQPQLPLPNPADKSYLYSLMAGVVLPLMQAIVTGILVSVLAVWLLNLVDLPWSWGVLAGLGTATWKWWTGQRRWDWVSWIEQQTGIDINNNGRIDEPRKIRVQIDEIKPDGHIEVTRMFDIPEGVTMAQLKELAHGYLDDGRPFSEGEWCGEGKTFSIDRFRDLRREFMKRGLVVQSNSKSRNLGYIFNRAGEHVLRGILNEPDE